MDTYDRPMRYQELEISVPLKSRAYRKTNSFYGIIKKFNNMDFCHEILKQGERETSNNVRLKLICKEKHENFESN